MKLHHVLALSLVLCGCAAAAAPLSADELATVSAVAMPEELARQLKSADVPLERFMATLPDYDEIPGPGVLVVADAGRGRAELERMRAQAAGTGFRAYIARSGFGTAPDTIAVVKADDYGYLGLVRTDGINHDLAHEEVLARYRAWDARYGLTLVGAGSDWLEAEFKHPPGDWLAFAREVYAFCPDVVDQGTGDVESLAREMAESGSVYLWWD